MSGKFKIFQCQSGFSSPPCLASEMAPDYFDPLAVDSQQASDVARWRKAERSRLRTARLELSVARRQAISTRLMTHLRIMLAPYLDRRPAPIISGYWPIKAEPDLRPLLAEICVKGFEVALPVVETKAAPLVFRRWTPETRMQRGDWNIPVPPPDAAKILPDIMLAPMIGWDGEGYRLGYGGGYFDRTLAAMNPRPLAIGIAFHHARLPTIYPQPHDIPMEVVLTEAGQQFP